MRANTNVTIFPMPFCSFVRTGFGFLQNVMMRCCFYAGIFAIFFLLALSSAFTSFNYLLFLFFLVFSFNRIVLLDDSLDGPAGWLAVAQHLSKAVFSEIAVFFF